MAIEIHRDKLFAFRNYTKRAIRSDRRARDHQVLTRLSVAAKSNNWSLAYSIVKSFGTSEPKPLP
eukprot:1045603-Alexandrium_andersonii.AAC.1